MASQWFRACLQPRGASGGMGEKIACNFARKGASLSLCGRDQEKLSKVAKKCEEEGAPKVITICADLVKVENVDRIVEETVSKLGQIDVLINNAGYGITGDIETAKVEDFDKLFAVNVKAPFYLIQQCVPHLKKTKGCIVNTSSLVSTVCRTYILHHSMAKCAIDHLTKSSALSLAKYGIRVNSVNPGVTKTDYFERMVGPEGAKKIFENAHAMHPLGETCLEPQEVADAVLYLASYGARCITGICLETARGRNVAGH
ncbi:putative oxidoreductase SSP0419 isoform X1 [Ciona intestinalis]